MNRVGKAATGSDASGGLDTFDPSGAARRPGAARWVCHLAVSTALVFLHASRAVVSLGDAVDVDAVGVADQQTAAACAAGQRGAGAGAGGGTGPAGALRPRGARFVFRVCGGAWRVRGGHARAMAHA